MSNQCSSVLIHVIKSYATLELREGFTVWRMSLNQNTFVRFSSISYRFKSPTQMWENNGEQNSHTISMDFTDAVERSI